MMFRRAFSTIACMDRTYQELLQACVKHHMQGVEVRMGDGGSVCGLQTQRELIEMQTAFRSAGIAVTNLGTSVCLRGYDPTQATAAKAAVQRASWLGTKAIRIFLGNFSIHVPDAPPSYDYDGIVEGVQEICGFAKQEQVEVWIETHNEFATGRVLAELLREVDRENCKIIWDVIHPVEDGETAAETWKAIGADIVHVHIKDGKRRTEPGWHDFLYTPLGAGDLPGAEMLAMLRQGGYQGFLSLEWEVAWREELQALPRDLDWILLQYNAYLDQIEKRPMFL